MTPIYLIIVNGSSFCKKTNLGINQLNENCFEMLPTMFEFFQSYPSDEKHKKVTLKIVEGQFGNWSTHFLK